MRRATGRSGKKNAPVTGVNAAREAGEERYYSPVYGSRAPIFRFPCTYFWDIRGRFPSGEGVL